MLMPMPIIGMPPIAGGRGYPGGIDAPTIGGSMLGRARFDSGRNSLGIPSLVTNHKGILNIQIITYIPYISYSTESRPGLALGTLHAIDVVMDYSRNAMNLTL